MVLEGVLLVIKEILPLTAFVGGIFAVEGILFGASIISAKSGSSLLVFLLGFLGVIFVDFLLYSFGRLNLLKRLIKSKKIKNYKRVVDGLVKKNLFKTMLFSKFIFGIRFFTPFYLGEGGIELKEYLLGTLTAALTWTAIMFFAGYFLGGILPNLEEIATNIQLGFTFIFLIFIALHLKKKAHKRVHKNLSR